MSWEVWTMKSRTLFCKLLKKDITRFAPAWALYTVFLMVCLPGVVAEQPFRFLQNLEWAVQFMAAVQFVYALICGELLFGDLYRTRLCCGLHALPVRREMWFFVHLTSGVLFALVPEVLACAVGMLWGGQYRVAGLWWLLAVFAQYLFFFGSAVLAVQCAGSRFSGAIIYGILHFFCGIAWLMYKELYEPLLYGVNKTMWLHLCPVGALLSGEYIQVESVYNGTFTQVISAGTGEALSWAAAYGAAGIVMMGLALLLYRRRRLETAGEMVAFEKLKPVFLGIFTVCAAAALLVFAELFLSADSMVGRWSFLTVGLCVGWFAGQMLLRRTVRVFRPKSFACLALVLAAVFGSLLLTRADPLGVTRWLPESKDVASVTVLVHDRKGNVDPQTAIDLHNLAIQRQENEQARFEARLTLTYTLKNGRSVSRSYWVMEGTEAYDAMKSLSGSPAMILGEGWEDLDSYIASIRYVEVDGQPLRQEDIPGFLNAVLADCMEGNMSQIWYYGDTVDPVETIWMDIEYKGDTAHASRSFIVSSFCVNTMNWLEAHGYPVVSAKYQ